MHEVSVANAREYLTTARLLAPDEQANIRALTGGVSNMVLLVETERGMRFVVKQARHQLRTREPWFSRVERIWREVEVLEVCQQLLGDWRPSANTDPVRDARQSLPSIRTPQILYVDRANNLFAMTAAPPDAVVWKSELLAGRADVNIAEACAQLLARMHARSWNDAQLAERLSDRSLFDELRVDPYYRRLARLDAGLRPELERLTESLEAHACALVHADFSPKNLLVAQNELLMVDFETGHYGDPAFDLGFFLSHLWLKAVYRAPHWQPLAELAERFWQTYRTLLGRQVPAVELAALERRAMQNLAGCLWARIDGKSPVEYLTAEDRRITVRHLAQSLLRDAEAHWPQASSEWRRTLEQL